MIPICLMLAAVGADPPELKVGTKSFTESVILGQVVTLAGQSKGLRIKLVPELGGTRILWDALRTGQIHVYPEYTGTIRQEIFAGETLPDEAAMRARLAKEGVRMTRPLGFNNTYALALTRKRAAELGVRKISDLRDHPELRFGFSNEFKSRGDGWEALKRRYRLSHQKVTGLQHTLAYQAIESGNIDVMDVYSTDSHIRLHDLLVLEDDLAHFPRYDAVFLYREEIAEQAPQLLAFLKSMEGKLDDAGMLELNQQVEINHASEGATAAQFLKQNFNVDVSFKETTLLQRLASTTVEHLRLVTFSLMAAILIAVPLGVLGAKRPLAGQLILGGAEVIQTIPGLALLVFMSVGFHRLGWATIGSGPVIVALFLYSLLPIIRNTMTGLKDVPASLLESAEALGLDPLARLRLVELPMASRMILAGIKTTAVINVGYAALGGLIGAGGYGQPIMTGLRLNSQQLMMEGAIPAAVLALLVKGCFELVEIFVVPKGLRLAASE